MTYSIVAIDSKTGTLGVAVASGSTAVATRVPWVEKNVGAIATQAYTNTMYGEKGLELLKQGLNPGEVLKRLLKEDPEAEMRQVAMLDIHNRKAIHTGALCPSWYGSIVGENYIIIGNFIVGEVVLREAEKTFINTEGNLVIKLLNALVAGEKAGGDRRGNNSSGIVVRGAIEVEERVDSSSNPAKKLYKKVLGSLQR